MRARIAGKYFGSVVTIMLLAGAATPAAAQGRVEIFTDRDAPEVGQRIAVGGVVIWYFRFWCLKNGTYQNDLVTPTVSGNPANTLATYNPTRIRTSPPTNEYTALKIATRTYTRPGNYTIKIGGRGSACPTYSPTYVPLTIAPRIVYADNGDGEKTNDLWWFNEEKPDGYPTALLVYADPANVSRYDWRISTGASAAEFIDGSIPNSPATVTNIRSVTVAPKGPPGLKKGQFTVVVSVNGVESDPYTLAVRRPFKIRLLPGTANNPNPGDVGDDSFGYISKMRYQIEDQLGKVLPKPVDAREVFTTNEIDDWAGTNWAIGKNAGYSGHPSNPANFTDTITGNNVINFPRPGTQKPRNPLGTARVMHFCGYVSVGSKFVGKGVMIATLTWQRFRDHARHCDLKSPAASLRPGIGLPACPGSGAANCP